MSLLSNSFLPAMDFTLSHLPRGVRSRLVERRQLLIDLLAHGGREGFLKHTRALGIRGKLTGDVQDVDEGGAELARALGEIWLGMKGRQSAVPSAYLPAECWASTLDAEWAAPRRWLEADDWQSFEKFLRNFFRSGGISGLWGNRDMFHNFLNASIWSDVERLAVFVRQYKAWRREVASGNLDDLNESGVGNPWGYDVDGRLVIEPAFEYHALALRIRELVAGESNPVVLEIGGGFGGLARQVLRLIPGVRYLGLDLPENVIIQSWYLTRSLPRLRIGTDCAEVLNRQDWGGLDAAILPNWALTDLRPPRLDVVVNVHSFGEMNRSTLGVYFAEINRLRPLWVFHDNLGSPRRDNLYGIPASEYPALCGYHLVASCESRWPRYDHRSSYPCRENLFRLAESLSRADADDTRAKEEYATERDRVR
jgi:putative sugar O-methyltransferase